MSTTGHENEAINVQGLKASLQKFKTDYVDGKAAKATTLQGYGITDAYTKNETYTKTEVNGLVSTPHQNYVTVATYASLPASGSADTIYRVSSYDGANSQVDDTVYSEYAWDGTQYVFLDVKSQIGEVFDITVYNSNTKYANLSAALGVNGVNIPESLRKGGMSVKYVHTSDNKYVRYNLLADSFTTDTTQWAIDDVGIYVDNPEFIKVYIDKKRRILWAIKSNGTIHYGAGVPPQVIDYIQAKINEYHGDDIIAFLDGLENEDKTLLELLNERGEYIDSPEFIAAFVDSKKRILLALEADGNTYFGAGVPKQIVDYVNEVIDGLNLDDYQNVLTFLGNLIGGDKTLSQLLSGLNAEIESKISQPQSYTNNHIVLFDNAGGIKDSGYDINNLPTGLPSGGNDADVLKTDGHGNVYWDSSTAPTQEQVDNATNDWLGIHGGAIAQIENNNEYDLCIADENGNIGEGIKNGNFICGSFNSVQNGNQWREKKWYAYGTSLTAPKSGKYPLYVTRASGMNIVNYGHGGAGIVKGLSGNLNGANLDAICNITDGKLEADLITIEVGANDGAAALGDVYDYTHDTTFCSALNTAIRYLLENTNAQIVVMSSSPGIYGVTNWEVDRTKIYDIDHTSGPDNHTHLDLVNAIEQVCKANGVHYIGWEDAGLGTKRLLANGTTYVVDQIHHSDLMGKILGEFIWSRLKDIPLWHTQTIDV